MINHYINFVCWRAMLELYDKTRDVVWVDSIILHKRLKRLGVHAAYKPGTSVLHRKCLNELMREDWYFFTAGASKVLPGDMFTVLPIMDKACITEEIKLVLHKLPIGSKVGIGVSAPKQNQLAVMMNDIRPDIEYHCLGAAISDEKLSSESNSNYFFQPESGLEWCSFLFKSPMRTMKKITETLIQLLLVEFSSTSKKQFLYFSTLVEHYSSMRVK